MILYLHNCVLIECPNYIVCENKNPQWVMGCHTGLCFDCELGFGEWINGKGILETKYEVDCCVCLDESCLGISLPFCSHYICVSCMKKIYFPKNYEIREPKFPYPELEIEYEDDPENPKWKIDPVILQYINTCNAIAIENERRAYDLDEKKKCPLCRR